MTSVNLAFEALGIEATITDSPEVVLNAERVVFPGVGAARAAMDNLAELGLVDTIKTVVARGTPFLGICVGMQILLDHSDENDGVNCLGLVSGNVSRFAPTDPYDKVPHMGWNRVRKCKQHPVFDGIENDSEFYFVHSYYPSPVDWACVLGITDYAGITFSSAIVQDNLVATQFHPEKSGSSGLRLLKNFTEWTPA